MSNAEPMIGTMVERTREQAIAPGWKRYYTGRPCRKGHLSERYVNGGACIQCIRPDYPLKVGRTAGVLRYRPELVPCPPHVPVEEVQAFTHYLREAAYTFFSHHHPECAEALRAETDFMNAELSAAAKLGVF